MTWHSRLLADSEYNCAFFSSFRCDATFGTYPEQQSHLKDAHVDPEDMFQCSECQTKCRDKKQLERHMRTEHKVSKNVYG
jgi:hypothetical protein